MHHSKWFDDESDLKIGDIIFLKHDLSFKDNHQYEMVENIKYSKKEKIWKVIIKHRNDNEKTKGDAQYPPNKLVDLQQLLLWSFHYHHDVDFPPVPEGSAVWHRLFVLLSRCQLRKINNPSIDRQAQVQYTRYDK